jgi:hypothetical protein
MAGHGAKIDRKWEQAIAALLAEPTVQDAARAAKVSYASLKGWLQEHEFVTAYRAARREVLEQAIGRLQQACGQAVETLVRNLSCGKGPVEVRAALGVLDQAARGLETTDLLAEVEALRQELEEVRRGHGEPETGGEEDEGDDSGPVGPEPPPGPPEGRPPFDHGRGRNGAGPVAGGPTAINF